MDLLRQSLGDEQLTYLGYSYGTTLGSTYAELFPDRVRALVLDAAVDPDDDPRAHAEQQATSLEASFDAFASQLRRPGRRLPARPGATPLPRGAARPGRDGADPQRAARGDAAGDARRGHDRCPALPVRHRPLAAADPGPRRRPQRRLQGLFSPLDAYWSRLQDGTYTNTMDANLAINCADTDPATRCPEEEVRTPRHRVGAALPAVRRGRGRGPAQLRGVGGERTPIPERDAEGAAPIWSSAPRRPGDPAARRGRHGRGPRLPASC
jgi:pimeloyl-ACP methyl ester carboxylesterase